MSLTTFLVIFFSIIFTLSGFYINFRRKIADSEFVKKSADTSLTVFRIFIPASLVLSILFYFSRIGSFFISNIYVYLGATFVVLGLIIRWYAVYRLGKFFRVQLSILKKQPLITDGIYKYIRHPSYTGLLLYYWGLAVIMHNIFSLVLLVVVPFYVVCYRINIEEKFLIENFKNDYVTYQKNSNKLFPFF